MASVKKEQRMGEMIFITGTDTGVGKTVMTALLLEHLREEQKKTAFAVKPFCSGGRDDAHLLLSLQPELTIEEVNPFHFRPALAPAVVLQKENRDISLRAVVRRIRALQRRCETLLVEGAGGLLVPLGRKFLVADLLAELGCKTIVVSCNRLGTINHTLLTTKYLEHAGNRPAAVVLMDERAPDASAGSNLEQLEKRVGSTPVFLVPFLGKSVSYKQRIRKVAKQIRGILAQIAGAAVQEPICEGQISCRKDKK